MGIWLFSAFTSGCVTGLTAGAPMSLAGLPHHPRCRMSSVRCMCPSGSAVDWAYYWFSAFMSRAALSFLGASYPCKCVPPACSLVRRRQPVSECVHHACPRVPATPPPRQDLGCSCFLILASSVATKCCFVVVLIC